MIRVLLFALAVLLFATFPATWLLMLFLGNLGLDLSHRGTLPLGILVSALLGGSSAGNYSPSASPSARATAARNVSGSTAGKR